MEEITLTQEYIDEIQERYELCSFAEEYEGFSGLTSSHSSIDFLNKD